MSAADSKSGESTWQGESKPTARAEFGRAAKSYAEHRLGFPDSMYQRLVKAGVLDPSIGQRLLDLGTGTGTLARKVAAMGIKSKGVDIDESMLEAARELATKENLDIEFRVCSADSTGESNESFDVVAAGQCWHWFDRAKTAAEVFRILKPGGVAVMCHYDWIAYPGNVVELSEDLIVKYCPDWKALRGNGVYPLWFRDLGEANFESIESFSYDEPAIYSHVSWAHRLEASAGIARLSSEKREDFKSELLQEMKQRFPDDPLKVHHRVFCVWGTKPLPM